jgi:hypothetical protein
MNKADHKEVAAIMARLAEANEIIDECVAKLDDLKNAEREKFDNMTEGLQQSEQGQRIESAADLLDNAHESAESASQNIGEAIEHCEGIE